MARAVSPLRYPGGKACLYDLMAQVLKLNDLDRGHYAEPYAGGAGLALALLVNGHVSDIHINDLDPAIWAIWYNILNDTDRFIKRMWATPVDIDNWHKQKDIYKKTNASHPLELGFAAFFLNRTNRSGIIGSGGVIGGKKQTGKYLVDCRFNKQGLERRIRRIAKYKELISLTCMDAIEFIDMCKIELPERSLLCIDPPYFAKGASLYANSYAPKDHAILAKKILSVDKFNQISGTQKFILTYDNVEDIRKLYNERNQYTFDLNYSVQTKRLGTELLVASKGMKLPKIVDDRCINIAA